MPRNDAKLPSNQPKQTLSSGWGEYYFFINANRVDIKGEKDSFFSIEFWDFNGTPNPATVSMSYRGTSAWTATANQPWHFKITKLDTVQRICAGVFSFKAVDRNGNSLDISDGRFDVKYAK